jgi:threonine/homoserine/homoserine lactone efflux protein
MGQAIGQVLPFAAGIAVNPLPIIAVVLLLATPRGRWTGSAFAAGWLFGLLILGVVVLVSPAGTEESGGPATWISIVQLILGALLLFAAVKQWRGRPQEGVEPAMPGWMGKIETFTPPRAFGSGALLSGANPKNLLLTLGADSVVIASDISGGKQALAYAVFAVLASAGVIVPLVIYFALGDRADPALDRLKTSLIRNNAVIMAVLMFVIGVVLVGDAISGLSA